jgi:hypothetical protein
MKSKAKLRPYTSVQRREATKKKLVALWQKQRVEKVSQRAWEATEAHTLGDAGSTPAAASISPCADETANSRAIKPKSNKRGGSLRRE